MTAFFTLLTPDGFVLAADGRASRSEDLSIRSDSEQKLFHLQDGAGFFGCGLSGTVVLTPENSDEVLIDLRTEVVRIAELLRPRRSKDLGGYAMRLGRSLNDVLRSAKSSGKLEGYPEGGLLHAGENGNTIARIYLNGYYLERPAHAYLRLSHADQKLNEPEVTCPPVDVGFRLVYGSDAVYKLVFESEDDRFAKYRVEAENVNDVIRQARLFIEAHADPVAVTLDEQCKGVG